MELFTKLPKIAKSNSFVSGLQGKAHAGWRFPPDTPLDLLKALMELVKKEVDELRYFADPKRRSDSFPTADSGGEAIAHDLGIEVSPDYFFRYDEC